MAGVTILVHVDNQFPVILAIDASNYSIGAAIMHHYPDGSEKPIAHASKTLTNTKRNYSQIENEALSIIYGVHQFHQYLASRQFELITDHQRLLTIYSPIKAIPVATVNKLQRWVLCLMGYSCIIRYKPNHLHANTDALSRLPTDSDESFIDTDALHIHHIHRMIIDQSPVNMTEVQSAVTQHSPRTMMHNILYRSSTAASSEMLR